jgi:hypothetical protein
VVLGALLLYLFGHRRKPSPSSAPTPFVPPTAPAVGSTGPPSPVPAEGAPPRDWSED